jgi:hypothetical protein
VCARSGRPCKYEKLVARPVAVVLQEKIGVLERRLSDLIQGPSGLGASTAFVRLRMTADTYFLAMSPSQVAPFPAEMQGSWWEMPTLTLAIHEYL